MPLICIRTLLTNHSRLKVQIKKSQLTANVMFTADNWDRTLLLDAWHRGQLQWRHRDWCRSRPEASIQRMKQKKKERKTRNQVEMSRISAEYALILSFKIPVLTEEWDFHSDEKSFHHPQLQIDTVFGHAERQLRSDAAYWIILITPIWQKMGERAA